MKSVPICTVDVLFLNQQMSKIILFKRNNEPVKGIYYTIGGRLLKDERLLDCAKRQAKREVRITLKNKDLNLGGIQEDIHSNSAFKGATYHAVGVFYYCIVDEDKFKPALDDQHAAFKWFEINSKKIHPLIRTRINQICKTK